MKILHFIPAFLFLIISAFLLCLPGTNDFPGKWWFQRIPQFDKLVHIGMFGLLCFLFQLPAWKSTMQNGGRQRWFWLVSLFAIGYGTGMEFIQRELIVNRSFEEADILADAVGAFGALALSQTLFLRKQADHTIQA